MNTQDELIKKITNSMSTILQQKELQILNNNLNLILYDYNISKDTMATEVSIYEGNRTEYLLQYFTVGKLSANKTIGTIKQYITVARQLCDMVNKELDQVTKEDVRYFLLKYQQENNVSSHTMELKRKYLSSLYGYLLANEQIKKNPMLAIDNINYDKTVKIPLKDDEIERIKLACKNKRDLAIVVFFLETGVRVSELCNIKISDIDFNSRKCKVFGIKGKKDRIVYFTGKSYVAIIDYLESRKDIDIADILYGKSVNKYLFTSTKAPYNKLTKTTVETMVTNLREPSGVERLHCHLFRTTCATNLALKGVSIELIAKLLGHASIATTQIYLSTCDEDLALAYKKVGSIA